MNLKASDTALPALVPLTCHQSRAAAASQPAQPIPRMSERPLYNSRITSAYVKLVEQKYPDIDLKQILRNAGIEPYQVNDAGHWFTQEQVNRFVGGLERATGNPNLAREAGRHSLYLDSLGFFKKYLLGLASPVNVFTALPKTSAKFTRSASYQARKLGGNRVELITTPAPGVQESPFQCKNRFGYIEAILSAFDCSNVVIEHPHCMFNGDPECRYLISWQEPLFRQVRVLRNLLTPALLGSGLLLFPLHHPLAGLALLAAVPVFYMSTSCQANLLEKKSLQAALTNLKESTDELIEQIGMNYNNTLLVNEVGQAISKQAGIDEVLENVVRALENRLSYDRGMILLANAERSQLSFRIGFGYSDEQLPVIEAATFSLDKPESQGVFVTCFRNQQPVLVNDFAEVALLHSEHSREFAAQIEAQAFLCCAIVCEGESLGVLAVDNTKSKKPLVQGDLSLMEGIAQVLGISIRNAMYIEREKQHAEQMRQSQKMEAIGQLAGGVAHDFNNLLTAIIGFTTLAQQCNDPGRASRFLDEVLFASERASHVTRGLLAFSRKETYTPQPVELNGAVEHIEKLLRRLISEEIELVLRFAEEPLTVIADPGQIDQILINLATNARDAMEHAGVLTIETGWREIAADPAAAEGSPAGRYARLSIRDTGRGMDEATQSRIFEPFFTTKEVGKGTGLGLAIVYGIVKQHRGLIEVESAPGRGTCFHILLPLPEHCAQNAGQDRVERSLPKGSGTVLVVEDAPEVRALTCQVLAEQGYRVIEAGDGEEALHQFRAHQDEIGLVIMDVVMPKLNGKEAFARIAAMRPETRVLFTSGYTPEDIMVRGVNFDQDNFLAKPCHPHDLLVKVAELMRQAPPSRP